jgi:glycosyltransferase involved in cell wall biosynthesis
MNIKESLKLSAYMVIKDEIAFLNDSIKSFVDEVDEVIIVDTGSTDGSWECAEEWQKLIPSKFRIHKFEMKGFDLSEARNYAMSLCTGDWILVVDGDEIWTKEELIKVRKLISNTDEVAFRPLSVRPLNDFNHCEAGIWMERIFKNGVDIHYKGIYPSDLSYHKEIPIYLYYKWPNIHYFHMASMKPMPERIKKWALYHHLSNPERSYEECVKSAQSVWHVSGQNPNTVKCPFPIPEAIKYRLTPQGGMNWKP